MSEHEIDFDLISFVPPQVNKIKKLELDVDKYQVGVSHGRVRSHVMMTRRGREGRMTLLIEPFRKHKKMYRYVD